MDVNIFIRFSSKRPQKRGWRELVIGRMSKPIASPYHIPRRCGIGSDRRARLIGTRNLRTRYRLAQATKLIRL